MFNPGLAIFAMCLASSSILSISSITNAMSGHEAIMTSMIPYLASFPLIVILFCISFSYFLGLTTPEVRRIYIFLLVAVAYLLSIVSLHLSTFIINLKYT